MPLTRCRSFRDAGRPVRVRLVAVEGRQGRPGGVPPPAVLRRCLASPRKLLLDLPRQLPPPEHPPRPARPPFCSNQIGAKFWEVRGQQQAALRRRHPRSRPPHTQLPTATVLRGLRALHCRWCAMSMAWIPRAR